MLAGGLTWLARRLGAHLSAIHIRSDVERKRLYRVGITEPSGALGLNIYTPEANARTFDTIEHLARSVAARGLQLLADLLQPIGGWRLDVALSESRGFIHRATSTHHRS